MARILLITIALIVYGSLYPFAYRAAPPGANPMLILLRSWPSQVTAGDLGDIAVNLFLYVPVGIFAFLALERRGRTSLRWSVPVLLGFTLSSALEMAQIFDRSRVCSLLDVFDNTLGALLGVAFAFALRSSIDGAVLLVIYWLGHQVCALCATIAHRRTPSPAALSKIEMVTLAAAWLLVPVLLASRDGPARARWWSVAAAGFLTLLVVRGLTPFHFAPGAAPFLWLPFASMFRADWAAGLPIFLQKSFYYGSAIWLFRKARFPIAAATSLVVAVLAAIEIAQRHLPSHTPEITDPVLALILGFILWQLELDRAHTPRSDMIRVRT